MKKLITIITLFITTLIMLIPTAHADYYKSYKILKYGMGGTEVVNLQNDLKNLGYFSGTSTGYYGTQTRAAVKEYQKDKYLYVDGIVGHYTATVIKRERVVQTAKWYINKPYLWGGTSPKGFDCSGFTQYIMKLNFINISRTSATQYNEGYWIRKTNLKKGDLVFFTTYKPGPSHLGIYIGNGAFIHASSGAGKIVITKLSNSYFKPRYIGARRIIY